MEVKPGFKQTEVGVIPEEWRDCDISDLCQLQRGFDLTEATRKRGDIPVYSSSGLSYFHNEARLQPPAVITGRKGMLGKVFFVEEPCWPHDTTLWVKDFKGNLPRFVALFLGQFRLERFDAATSVPTLNRNNVVGIPIKLPPLPEQRAIATALSDVDGLLGGLERLIAKKRDLKQAAMQQLLTGQTRLPGFHGEWEVKRLPEISWFQEGPGLRDWQFTNAGMKVINVTNLENGVLNLERTDRHISHSEFNRMYQHFAVDAGDIVMASSGNSYSKAAIVRTQDLPLVMNTSVIRFKPVKKTDYGSLWALLTSPLFKSQIDLMITGGAQPNFGPYHLERVHFPAPPLPEQTSIAEVLTEMDAELAGLTQRLEKTRALKQAMMQELLTGRIRLIARGDANYTEVKP
jgi:type I restriction enzyme S subunit